MGLLKIELARDRPARPVSNRQAMRVILSLEPMHVGEVFERIEADARPV